MAFCRYRPGVSRVYALGAAVPVGDVSPGTTLLCVGPSMVGKSTVLYRALAAAAADTWATEIGEMDRSRPWSLRWGERVQTGRSGAVSLVGTLGAVCGAASVVGAAALVDGALGSAPWDRAVVVVGAGLCGMAVDSLAGAFLQAQYRDPETDRVVERPPTPDAVPVRGWGGINNEVVNLIGTAAGTIAAMVLS